MKVYEEILKRLEALEARQKKSKPMRFDEACDYLGYSKKTLYNLCYTGKIPCYNPTGRALFFIMEELDEWIKGKCIKAETSEPQKNSSSKRGM